MIATTMPEPASPIPQIPQASPSAAPLAHFREGISLQEAFARVAKAMADRSAIEGDSHAWTYRELDEHSDRVARAVVGRCGGVLQPVAILADHDAPLVGAILGLLKAGKAYVSLDPQNTDEQLRGVLDDSHASIVLVDSANHERAERLAPGATVAIEPPAVADSLAGIRGPVLRPTAADALACIAYTSGSTGRPKGVARPQADLLHNAVGYIDAAGIGPGDRLSLLHSTSLAASTSHLFAAMLSGATLLPISVRRHGANHLVDWVSRRRVTVLHTTASLFRQLLAELPANESLPDLRFIRLGGEAAHTHDFDLFRGRLGARTGGERQLMVGLSSTETGMIRFALLKPADSIPGPVIPLRLAYPGTQTLIVDDAGRPAPLGEVGRVCVRSRFLPLGYWRRPDLTAEAFVGDPEGSGERCFLSNDLGRLLPDGSLEWIDRRDDVVKVRGLRVNLKEVEAAVLALPGVAQAAILAVTGEDEGREVAAYVVPHAGWAVDAAQWRAAARRVLPSHAVPAWFVSLESLPRTAGGKIDRSALPSPREDRTVAPGEEPRTDVQKRLAAIWHEVLQRGPVGIRDDFFDLGGHSIHVAKLLSRITEEFGRDLSMPAFLQSPTIEGLALALAGQSLSQTHSLIVPVRTSGTRRPIFCVHGGDVALTTLVRFARRLPVDRPVYGLRWPGLGGEGWPPRDVSGMAANLVAQVRSMDPTGPYMLAGFCVGGIVAWEMGLQLRRAGLPVSIVALFDSPDLSLHPRRLSARKRLTDAVRDHVRTLRWWLRAAIVPARRDSDDYRTYVEETTSAAIRRFRAKPGGPPAAFFLAQDQTYPGSDPREALHAKLGGSRAAIRVPGDHDTYVTSPNLEIFAKRFEELLDEVEGERQT
ncbi:MAG: AMP-binding protein [Planctomycetota bacterium]|nr:AMP-binding protein [Planctomycetota bacterium]